MSVHQAVAWADPGCQVARRTNHALSAYSLLLLLALVPPQLARTQPQVHPVLLLVPSDSPEPAAYDELLSAIKARLSTMPVEVLPLEMEREIDEDVALELAGMDDTWSVVWLSPDTRHFFLLTPQLAPQPQVRPLTGDGEDWVSQCEAMAAMLFSELKLVIARASIPLEVLDIEAPPPEPVVEPPSSRPLILIATIGYTPVPLSRAGPVIHGLSVGIGARLGPYFGLWSGVDITQQVPLGINEGQAQVSRWPLRAAATVTVPLGRFEPGVNIGAVLEIVRLHDLGYEMADPGALDPHLAGGISAEVSARYRLWPWLGPFLCAGADFFFIERSVTLGGTALVRRERVVFRLVAGISVLIDLRRH